MKIKDFKRIKIRNWITGNVYYRWFSDIHFMSFKTKKDLKNFIQIKKDENSK